MIRRNSKYFAVILGVAALLALAAAPVAASPSGVTCPGTRVPAFESPDVTLTPVSNPSVWTSSVTVVAFCEDISNPSDMSIRLQGITVSAVTVLNVSGIPDLTMSISKDGTAPFVPIGAGFSTFTTSGITSDSNGNATFVISASSASTPYLGGPDSTARLLGMHFEVDAPGPGGVTLPDEGFLLAQTPELDSLILFGSGAVGLAGYSLMRIRSRRRPQ